MPYRPRSDMLQTETVDIFCELAVVPDVVIASCHFSGWYEHPELAVRQRSLEPNVEQDRVPKRFLRGAPRAGILPDLRRVPPNVSRRRLGRVPSPRSRDGVRPVVVELRRDIAQVA